MRAKLVLTSIDGQIRQEIPLDKPRITIGRKPSNDLNFNRPEMSGNHAEIFFDQDSHFVMDLGSTNGTLLNGAQLVPNQRYSLQEDDVVTIAPFRISYIMEQRTMETIVETSGNKAPAFEAPWRVPTGTEEHKVEKKEAAAVVEAPPPPPPSPPAQESKPVPPEVAAPAPPPAAAPEKKPEPVSVSHPPAPAKSSMADYLWMGIGILVFLAALGLIVFVMMME